MKDREKEEMEEIKRIPQWENEHKMSLTELIIALFIQEALSIGNASPP